VHCSWGSCGQIRLRLVGRRSPHRGRPGRPAFQTRSNRQPHLSDPASNHPRRKQLIEAAVDAGAGDALQRLYEGSSAQGDAV
jgi:hypothetical protein